MNNLIFSILLIMAMAMATLVVSLKTINPTEAITATCSRTLYPDLCLNSLVNFPGSVKASEQDLLHINVNMTLNQFGQAASYFTSSGITMDPHIRAAYDDCFELLDDSVDYLSRSMESIAGGGAGSSSHDVMTWLSSALTNHDTCVEGLSEVGGINSNEIEVRLKDLSEMVSNCLAVYAASAATETATATEREEFVERSKKPRRGRRTMEYYYNDEFPTWMSKKERYLLDAAVEGIKVDIVVSKDGTVGTVKTIAEAIQKAAENSNHRTVIYVKAGRYEEDNLKVGKKKINLMLIGVGKGKTVISGGKSVMNHITTFRTATFAASGEGFIARDITFENWAGPEKNQAVALRISADKSAIYRCSIIGYQDTLYVHRNRQFFRECDVYGTVDFIFGNAAVVFQNCNLYARKPLPNQKITITAQNRNDPHQNTGISVHASKILADADLESSKGSFATYLGRPWKTYSRTVYMVSYMGDHVNPKGWLEWNGSGFGLNSLYYGEYENNGPGSALGGRVKWPGYRVITTAAEATKFTVGQFILGSSWLPATGVTFVAGL